MGAVERLPRKRWQRERRWVGGWVMFVSGEVFLCVLDLASLPWASGGADRVPLPGFGKGLQYEQGLLQCCSAAVQCSCQVYQAHCGQSKNMSSDYIPWTPGIKC